MTKAIVYGDVSPNVIDGSSIWLMSITETLAGIFGEVHLLLKMKPQHDQLIGGLKSIDNVVLHEPNLASGESELTSERAAVEISRLVTEFGVQAVVARGMDLCNSLCRKPNVADILWSYITDLPFPLDQISSNGRNRLRRIALNSRRLLAQTEGARSYLEGVIPEAAGKTVLMRPMIPNETFVDLNTRPRRSGNTPLSLIYAGKFAASWKTLEMLELPRALRQRGIEAELRVVGNKFNRDRRDPAWVGRMQSALSLAHEDLTSGVTWVGGLSREQSMEEIVNADIGIGWRTGSLDTSLEISTKALEYSAAGTVPLINRTSDNAEMFGDHYPLFVTGNTTVDEAAAIIEAGLPSLDSLGIPAQKVAKEFSFRAARSRLWRYFSRAGALSDKVFPSKTKEGPVKIVIAAHDFKFLGEIIDQLEHDPGYEIRYDRWQTLHQHDEAESKRLAEWADTVFCEWAGPNLKWYSQNVTSGTRLISRLHGFELRGAWLADVVFENVSAMVFVSSFYREKAMSQLDLDPTRAHTISNMVDLVDFDRPKLAGAQFNIGMVGMVPFLKRPDRALRLLELLLEADRRYTLVIKGRMPWDYPYEWNKPLQKQAYLEFFNRVASDKELSRHVIFDDFGPEIASWFRNIGIILSPSDRESFHLAPAEGMASRAVPIVWGREGSASVFGKKHVYSDIREARDTVLSLARPSMFEVAGDQARLDAGRFDIESAMSMWKPLLCGKAMASSRQGRETL